MEYFINKMQNPKIKISNFHAIKVNLMDKKNIKWLRRRRICVRRFAPTISKAAAKNSQQKYFEAANRL